MNPFFSLQVTKDQYGGKVIHPNINLHVTPSEHLLTKIFDKKKNVKQAVLFHKLGNLGNQHHFNYAPTYSSPTLYHEVPPPYLDYNPIPAFQSFSQSNSFNTLHKPFLSNVPPSFSPANDYSPYFHYAPSHHTSYRNRNITDQLLFSRKSNEPVVFPNTRRKRHVVDTSNSILESVSYSPESYRKYWYINGNMFDL